MGHWTHTLPLEEWDVNISSTLLSWGDTVMLEIKYFKMSFLTYLLIVVYFKLNTLNI